MFAYLLILGMAYAIASSVAASKPGYGRTALGFVLAVVAAWLLGSSLVAQGTAFLAGLLGQGGTGSNTPKQVTLYLLQRGFWWAVIGALLGVLRAKYKVRQHQKALLAKAEKQKGRIALAVILLGGLFAVAVPAYKDYTNRSQKPWLYYQAQQTAAVQPTAALKNFDPSTATPANSNPENSPRNQTDQAKAVPHDDWGMNDRVISQDSDDWGKNDRVISQDSSASGSPTDAANDEHLRRIYAAHPDADAIFASNDFNTWMASYPAYQRIAAEGNTQEVIEMFTAYKNQRQYNPFNDPNYGK